MHLILLDVGVRTPHNTQFPITDTDTLEEQLESNKQFTLAPITII